MQCGNIASRTNGAGCIYIRNTHVPYIYKYNFPFSPLVCARPNYNHFRSASELGLADVECAMAEILGGGATVYDFSLLSCLPQELSWVNYPAEASLGTEGLKVIATHTNPHTCCSLLPRLRYSAMSVHGYEATTYM